MNTTELERKLVNLESSIDRLTSTIQELQTLSSSEQLLESIVEKLDLLADYGRAVIINTGSVTPQKMEVIDWPKHPRAPLSDGSKLPMEETLFVDGAGVKLLKTNFHYKEVLTNKPVWIDQIEYRVTKLESIRSSGPSIVTHVFTVERA